MKTFEELKQELLSRAENEETIQELLSLAEEADYTGAADEELETLQKLKETIEGCETKLDLLNVITAYWIWVLSSAKIIDIVFLEDNFTEDELHKARIYTKGKHEIITASYVCGSATVKAYHDATVIANDDATVEAYDSVTVSANDRTTVRNYKDATVYAHNSATVATDNFYGDCNRVYAWDNATVEAYGNTTVYAHDSAKVRIHNSARAYAHDDATVIANDDATVIAYDSVTVIANDRANVEVWGGDATVRVYDDSYVKDYTGNVRPRPQSNTIVRDFKNHRIYVKKGKFEIVEVD